MPQRKTAKRAKSKKSVRNTRSKRTGKQDVLGLVAKIEGEFLHVPSRLVALCRQEQNTVKNRHDKLKTSLKTLHTKQSNLQKKLKALSSKKKSSQNTKQINIVKKALTQTNILIKNMTKVSVELNKISTALANKQAKFIALGKQLLQLEKQLKNKKMAKPAKARKKSAAPKRAKARKNIPVSSSSGDSITPTIYDYNASGSSVNETENS
ncbi:MAG: hypothetical protein SFW66_09190 [Gammaproteobacteria bacterium]|nr:hypothetical protein [Gammaproteobacteria bacterium]